MSHLEMTPQDLLDAYIAETGLRVSMSYQRDQALQESLRRGITPEDIRLVMRELKKLVQSTRREHECYTDRCLDFNNAIGNADKLEERVLRLRQREARKPKKQAPVAVTTGDVTRLVEAPPKEPNVIDVSAALRGIADDIKKHA